SVAWLEAGSDEGTRPLLDARRQLRERQAEVAVNETVELGESFRAGAHERRQRAKFEIGAGHGRSPYRVPNLALHVETQSSRRPAQSDASGRKRRTELPGAQLRHGADLQRVFE